MENTNTQTNSSDDLSKYIKDNDVLLKGLVMWIILPVIGPLFFLNDVNPLVKFNAKQSLYVSLAEIILGTILSICMIPIFFITFGIISFFLIPVGILPVVLHFYMVYKMNKGEKYYLPYIGKLSE